MSEIVDRVAAVFAAELMELTAEQRKSFVFPDDCNGDTIDRARSAARSAIEAMREPTDAMIKAGAAVLDEDWCTETNALNIWQAMCDEALK